MRVIHRRVRSVYIAGPLFSPAERAYLETVEALCRSLGFKTYLPHRDVGVGKAIGPRRREFFSKDLAMLKRAQMVVAVLNGSDADSGTAWEVGYAFASRKPVLAIREDFRMNEVNIMLSESAEVVSSLRLLRARLRAFGRLKAAR